MRGIRFVVCLLFGLSVGLIGCDSGLSGPTGSVQPTMQPDILSALWPVCDGDAVAGAGTVDTSGTRINHLVMLDTGDLSGGVEPRYWLDALPAEWAPRTLADAALVACAGEPTTNVVEVCPYIGSDVTRYEVTREFEVLEASSGRTLATFTITAMPRECHSTENASLTELQGVIDSDAVISHLTGLVEHGRYADPGDGGASHEPGTSDEPTPAVEEAALREALADGLISIKGTGDGLQHLDVELTSKVDYDLELTIEVGTLLEPRARGTQLMVVIDEQTVSLAARATATATLDVACAEMHQGQPTGDDTFRVLDDRPAADLARLLETPEFRDFSGRVQQFAVWTITNNPKRNDYVGLTSGFSLFGTGPDDTEIASIRTLFEMAGIDTSKYRALR